jgi:hypothetical protein
MATTIYFICLIFSFIIIKLINKRDRDISERGTKYPYTMYQYYKRKKWYKVLTLLSFVPYVNLIVIVSIAILLVYLLFLGFSIKD